jgi:hypothetical protein
MMLVVQIAAGIVVSVFVLFISYGLFLDWAENEPARRQARKTAAQKKEEQ